MKWVKHMTNSFEHEFVAAVVDELGLLGFGLLVRLIDIISAKYESGGKTSCTFSASKWGKLCELSTDDFLNMAKKIQSIARIFKDEENSTEILLYFSAITERSVTVEIPNLSNFKDNYTKQEERNAKADTKKKELQSNFEDTSKSLQSNFEVTSKQNRIEKKRINKEPPLSPPTRGEGVVASLPMATPVAGEGVCLAEAVPVGEVLPVELPEHVTLVTFVQPEPVERVELLKPVTPVTLVQATEEQPAPVQVESPTAPIVQQAMPEPVEQEEQEDSPRSFISKAAQLAQRFKAKRLAEQQARPRLSSSAPVAQSPVQSVQQAQPTAQAGPTPQVQPQQAEQPHPQGKAAQAAYVERSDTMPSVAPSPVTPEQAQARLECLLLGTARTAASPVQPPRSRRNRNAATTGDYSPEFLTFWNMYPRKVAKEAAYRAWVQRARTRTLPPLDTLSAVLSRQAQTKQWLKNDGQYIPFPATWLHQARWEGSV